jgi:predicted pyridoxine 5'-phosphate oxidase superfamily flavin-nucleotide-binding protein
MTISQSVREVIETGPLAHLTTLNTGGRPQVTVVWVGIEGEEFVMGHLALHQKSRTFGAQGLREHVVVHGGARVTQVV